MNSDLKKGLHRLKDFIQRKNTLLLWVLIIAYILIFTVFCFFKYKIYAYNGIDLAIYNQVFYNSSFGRLFNFTIHPHLYLGDHFEPFILILLPFYFLFRSPYTILFLQTLFIGLSAWPLYLIAKNKLGRNWALLISSVFLLNPFIQNANLFEFHLLPFAMFFLFFTFYFYQKGNFRLFLVFSFLALLIREDVSLVIFMFGFLALIEKKKLKWIIIPIIMAGVWFILSFQLISFFNPDNNYKFFAYYSWLGNTPNEIIKSIFTHPLLLLKHLLSFQNIILVFVFLIPFAFLPILALRYLVPALLIALQIFLSGFSDLIFKTHYHSLITPFLFISSIYGLHRLINQAKTAKINSATNSIYRIRNYIQKHKTIFIIIPVICIVYSSFTLGPFFPTICKMLQFSSYNEVSKLKNDFLAITSQNLPIAAGFQFLPPLSNRDHLYSLHYAFLGKKQYSQEDYILPDDTEELLIDFNDFIIYQIQSQNIKSYEEQYPTGGKRIEEIIKKRDFGLVKIIDNYALFKKGVKNDTKLYEISDSIDPRIEEFDKNIDGKILFIGWRKMPIDYSLNQFENASYQILPISFSWQALVPLSDDYQLLFELADKNGVVVYKKLYPLAYGLYPTSKWNPDEIVNTNYWFLIPKKLNYIDYDVNFSLVTLKGYMSLDGTNSVEMKINELKILGEKLK